VAELHACAINNMANGLKTILNFRSIKKNSPNLLRKSVSIFNIGGEPISTCIFYLRNVRLHFF
jgi:hypothetical protein